MKYTYLKGEWIEGTPTIKQYRKAIRQTFIECSGSPVYSCAFMDGMWEIREYKKQIKQIQESRGL